MHFSIINMKMNFFTCLSLDVTCCRIPRVELHSLCYHYAYVSFLIRCNSLLQVVTDKSKVFPKDTEAPLGGVDDMTKLSYLHEPGVLENLATRYKLNEIYVSVLVQSLCLR